ncbi:MAG: response regulator [candidate division KSB1 bacterium]|nr:response regulator [candidate division KSB1 bacterium]
MSGDTSILLVDDEAIVRESLSAWLEDEGFVVYAAGSGEEALGLLAKAKPDVAVIDIKMPGMDGLTLLKRLRELDDRLPVVMMTAHATVESAVRSMRDGAYDYVMKPFPPEKLTNLIRHIVSHHRLALAYDQLHADWEQVRPWLAYSRQLLNLGQAFEGFVSQCGREIRAAVDSLQEAEARLQELSTDTELRRAVVDCVAAAQSQARASLRAIENALRCVTEGRPQPHPVRVNESAEQAWAILRNVPQYAHLTVHTRVPADTPAVRAEFWSLVQVFQNLIDFAASSLGGRGSVEVEAITSKENVEIHVSVPGEVPPPHVMAAVQTPPFLGQCLPAPLLGLVVARIVAERYGGRFEIRPVPPDRFALVVVLDRAETQEQKS